MILTAHQPVYLPWLGLLHKIALSDVFCIFDTVQYLKKDWNNRNKIKTPSGPIWLTVPVLTHEKFHQLLKDVEINNTVDWRKKHLKSLEFNYAKTPYFYDYIDFFQKLYQKEWKLLAELNEEILRFFLKELNIKVKIVSGRDLNLEGQKSDLVLDMCKKIGADTYIFGALGKDYAEIDKFKKENIKIVFQDYQHPHYSQQFGDFEPYLSAIDLLFNCGKNSYDIIMNGNITKTDLL